MPPTTASARTAHWLWPPLLLLGCVTALIAWLLIALTLGNQAGWMAVVAALEIVWMLRLGTLRAGRLRIGVAVVTTALIIAGANWGIARRNWADRWAWTRGPRHRRWAAAWPGPYCNWPTTASTCSATPPRCWWRGGRRVESDAIVVVANAGPC